eukprot:1217158-Pyramimonas_sp.AAC.1
MQLLEDGTTRLCIDGATTKALPELAPLPRAVGRSFCCGVRLRSTSRAARGQGACGHALDRI